MLHLIHCFGESGDYPTAEEEAKFEEMLGEKGWALKLQKGDGNCLFRAFSEHIYGDPENHPVVRRSCFDYMVMTGKDGPLYDRLCLVFELFLALTCFAFIKKWNRRRRGTISVIL